MTEAERRGRLFDEGIALLDAAWDDDVALIRQDSEHGALHSSRGTFTYAWALLRRDGAGDRERAERAVRAGLALQETREDDAHRGNFRWYAEQETVIDLNAVEFCLDGLNAIAHECGDRLSPELREDVLRAIGLGLEEIDRLDVHPSYTNIALSDVSSSVLGGEATGDETYVERGRRRLDDWLAYTCESGAPQEFNSPTYLAVDLLRLAAVASRTSDAEIALKARVAEERLWLHVAAHYHPGLARLAGPHARSYRDGWTGAPGYLSLILWRLLGDEALRRPSPYFARGREEGHIGVAAEELHCPGYILDWLRERAYPSEAHETSDATGGVDLTTYMTEAYTLGTASQVYAAGDPPEPSQQFNSTLLQFRRDGAPGTGTLFARYIVDDRGAGPAVDAGDHAGEDHWDVGRFVGAQSGSRAILAYGLGARLRPVRSYKLSVRVLGVADETEVWVGDAQVREFPARVEAGEPVVIAEGDAYIAVIALEPTDMGHGASIELGRDGPMLMLDIYNYRGPAKTFWEYRSLAGPFYHGNVRNAFVLEVASKGDFADAAAFRRHIAAARIADSAGEDYVREIAYASDGGSVTLRYSLWDMSLVERRYDGAVYTPPMARAGATDGGGPQLVQSRESLIEIGEARLMAGGTPKWLFADADRGRYVFANPADEVAPLWLETPGTIVECDAFGFGRVEVDEGSGVVTVEAVGLIAPLRLRREGDVRLVVNGVDVSEALVGPDGAGVREFSGV
ncbi:MAG: hypothetical protein WEC75_10915 [Dehalococcoidia bacterium]